MNIREKLIDAYQKDWDNGIVHNAYIDMQTNGNLIIWTNNPAHRKNVLPIYIDGKKVNLGETIDEAMKYVKKYNLAVADDESYTYIAIPYESPITIAMEIDEDVKDGSDCERDYVSGVVTFIYNGLESCFECMEEKDLENMFKEA